MNSENRSLAELLSCGQSTGQTSGGYAGMRDFAAYQQDPKMYAIDQKLDEYRKRRKAAIMRAAQAVGQP